MSLSLLENSEHKESAAADGFGRKITRAAL